jgi:O-antigen ligase
VSTKPNITQTSVGIRSIADVVMLLAIVWVRLPLGFGGTPSTSVRVLALAPLIAGIATLLPLRRPDRYVSLLGTLVGLFTLLIIVELFRGQSAGVYGSISKAHYEAGVICLLLVFGYLYFASALSSSDRDRRMFILCCVPGTYVAVNVVMHVAGFNTPPTARVGTAGTPAQLLGLVGIHATRAFFPLSDGVVNFGDIVGVALAASGILAIRVAGRQRLLAILLLMASIYAILATDARGALLCSMVAIILVLLVGRRCALACLAFFVPATTAIVSSVLGVVAHTSLVGTFSRNGNDLVTASDRTLIWHAVLTFLSHPSLTQLYGYGASGQISSGANLGYEYLFYGTTDPSSYSAHNFMLQTVLDIGYMGLLVFIVLLYLTARRLQKMIIVPGSFPAEALLCTLVYFVLNGATDPSPSLYTIETLYFFLLTVTCAATVHVSGKRKKVPRPNMDQQYSQTLTRARGAYQAT